MEKNNNNHYMIFKPKRPKIKITDEFNNNEELYQPLISENITLENIKNLSYNRSLTNHENLKKMENKTKNNSEINKKQKTKKALTTKQKKLKNLIKKISSPKFKIKLMFDQWITYTFNNKKNLSVTHLTEDGDEDDGEEEEEEEEEDDDEKINLMNDLNINGLEEIEERPPNEEESALTSILAKSGRNKNKIYVALRKIIKYKNFFYRYFYHWHKIINIPNILLILKTQKLLKNSIINIEEKKKLSYLSYNFNEWKKKSEQIKANEKKAKKKKKIIIYKKKNGEIEIKDQENNSTVSVNVNVKANKNENENLSSMTKKDKSKNIKIKAVKKNLSLLKKTNDDEIENQNKKINRIKIPLTRNETDIFLNYKTEEKITKTKKIAKKVNKIIKKIQKDKGDEYEEKMYSRTSEVLPDLSRSSGHIKIMKSFNFMDNNDNNNNNNDNNNENNHNHTESGNINISLSSIKKAIAKKKIKKINIKNVNKSFDLLQKDKKIINSSFSQSNNQNIESIIDKIDDIFHGKDNDNENDNVEEKEKDAKIKKKKIKNLKMNENKTNNEKNKISFNKEEKNNKDEMNINEEGDEKNKISYNNNKKKEFKIFSPNNNHFRSKIKQSDYVEFSVEENNLNNHRTNDYIINSTYNSKEIKVKNNNDNNNKLTKEENEKYKIYNKAFLILRKVIKSFKKRNKLVLKDNEKVYNYFNKWKNAFNKLNNNNDETLKNEIEIKNNNILEKNKKISKNSYLNSKKKKNVINDNNKNNKDISHKYNNKKIIESEKIKLLKKIINIAQSNNKTQSDIINIIKRTDKKTVNNLDLGNYIKMLEMNNKKLYAYKIFCLFVNYNENKNFCMKKNNPKKYFFNYWNRNNSNI